MAVDIFATSINIAKVIVKYVIKRKKTKQDTKPQQHWVNDDNEPRIKSLFHHKSIIIDWHFANEQQTRLYFNRFCFFSPQTQDRMRSQCFRAKTYTHTTKKYIWFITFSKIITNLDKLVAFAFRLTTNDTSSSMALIDVLPSPNEFHFQIIKIQNYDKWIFFYFLIQKICHNQWQRQKKYRYQSKSTKMLFFSSLCLFDLISHETCFTSFNDRTQRIFSLSYTLLYSFFNDSNRITT